MTSHFPRTARPSAHRRARRLLATVLAGLAGAVLAVATVVPAVAAPSPSPSSSAELSGTVTATLSPAAGGVVRTGSALSAVVALDNGTAGAVPAGSAALELGTAPLPDRTALGAWLAGNLQTGLAPVGTPVATEATDSGQQSTADFVIAPDDASLAGRGPGVYPLRVSVTAGDQRVTALSAMVVPDDAVASSVAVVVPIVAPVRSRGLISSDDLAALTAEDGALTSLLDAVDGTSAILAVDPAIPAAIRVLGSAAPATAAAWLARLEALPNARFALQFGDADLATQVSAGLTAPLAPISLATYIPAGTTLSTPSPSPTSTPPQGTPAQEPQLAQLTDIGPHTSSGVFWPASGSAGPEVLSMLTCAAGGSPSLTLVPSDTTAAGSGTALGRATSGGAQLAVYDSAVSGALRRAADQPDAAARGASLTEATAYLAFAARDSAGQPLVVAVDRGATSRDRAALRTAIQTATTAPGVTAIDMTTLAAASPVETTVAPNASTPDRGADLTQLLADEGTIGSFATILDDPALLTGRERAEILQLIAVAWRSDPAAAQAIAAHRTQTRETLDAVGILPSAVLNLVSYDATFSPWVRNDLPWPVRVELIAQPNNPQLVVGQRTEVVASAASNTRATIPVRSRVGNGAVTVTMQLYSPTGVAIGQVQSAEVQVRAEWETIGLVILIVIMVLFLSVGVVRTVRRRRRARELRAAADAADGDPAPLDPRVLEPEVRVDSAEADSTDPDAETRP